MDHKGRTQTSGRTRASRAADSVPRASNPLPTELTGSYELIVMLVPDRLMLLDQ